MDPQTITIILGALLAMSEALSLIPTVKSNGIFQAIFNVIKTLTTKHKGEAS